MPDSADEITAKLWALAGIAGDASHRVALPRAAQCLPSSFQVGLAAQSSIAVSALAAAEIYRQRTGVAQKVAVDMHAAERECTALYRLDGRTPDSWEKYSGLYKTRDGHVRIHANFAHHRDGALALLGLPAGEVASKEAVAEALLGWSSEEFETAAAQRSLVVSAARTFEQWDAHPQALAMVAEPPIRLTKIADADPQPLSGIASRERPLTGVRVLELTRILAGPICGRTLAAYGADVMLVNSPKLPNIPHLVDTSRGKRSVHLDLQKQSERERLDSLLTDNARVFVHGYRPGGISDLGFGPQEIAARHPGMISVSLSAYGWQGPWADRRGFDSLVQTATGFNLAEARAAGASQPKALPIQVLDFASGFLMAFGAQAALLRQAEEGGSWQVDVSLLGTAQWLRALGRVEEGFDVPRLKLGRFLTAYPCSYGELEGMPHAAKFDRTEARWERPSSRPGSDPARW